MTAAMLSTKTGSTQDMIVRIYGDTIRCKIDREDQRFIYYRTPKTKRGETDIISRKEINEIVYGIDDQPTNIPPPKKEKRYDVIQGAVHAGYSRILSEDDLFGEDFSEVYDEMRGGIFIDGRINYFLNEEIGLGVLYSNSTYDSELEGVVLVDLPSGNTLSGRMLHDRTLNYYALNLAYRVSSPLSSFNLQLDVGFGVLSFRDEAIFVNNYTLESNSLGFHLSGSFQLDLGEGFYLPAYLSLKGFNLSEFDFNPSPDMDPELAEILELTYNNLGTGISASRIQLGLGLGFSF